MLQFFAQASRINKEEERMKWERRQAPGEESKTVDAFSKDHQLCVKSFVQLVLIPFDTTNLYAVTSASGACGTM